MLICTVSTFFPPLCVLPGLGRAAGVGAPDTCAGSGGAEFCPPPTAEDDTRAARRTARRCRDGDGARVERCCQVNDIRATQRIDGFIPLLFGQHLGAGHLMPFTKCPRAKLAIVNRSRQVPTQPEQIAYQAINRKKALSLSR